MSITGYGWIEEGLRKAKEAACDLQPWPDYFEFKAEELKTILRFYEFSAAGSILEIGCGNAFTSCLLSRRAGRVEAFDLPAKDPVSHSVGIHMAEKLAERMHVDNMGITGGTVSNMPYKDGVFGVIFSQYMLHYVEDKNKALSEIRRVLADEGVMVMIVPNFTERVFMPIIKCEYIISRLMARFMERSFAKSFGPARTAADRSLSPKPRKVGVMSQALNDYILLRPDGAYRTYIQEMLSHRPRAWRRLLEENGFKVRAIFSTQILPLGLFGILGISGTRFLSGKIHYLTRAVGGLPIMKGMGYSLGLVAVKGRGV